MSEVQEGLALVDLTRRREAVLGRLSGALGCSTEAITGKVRGRPRLVSVVMPVRNGGDWLLEQVESLAGQQCRTDFELVIADNGTTDGSIERVTSNRWPFSLRVVDATDAPGASHARNVGALAALGELLVFCDSDDIAAETWLDALVSASAPLDLVAGILEHDRLNSAEIRPWRDTEPHLTRPLGFLPFGPGSNLAVWKDVWVSAGGWEERFTGAAGEDVEFCWRAQLLGASIGQADGAVMHYRHRDDLQALARQVHAYALNDVRLFKDYRRHGARRRPLKSVVGRWSYTLTRLPYLVLSRQRRGFWVLVTMDNVGRLRGSLRYRVLCL